MAAVSGISVSVHVYARWVGFHMWNVYIVNYSSVLLQYFVASFGMGFSRYIRRSAAQHHFAKRNLFRESFSNKQCLVCSGFSGSVLETNLALSCQC